MSKLRDPDYYLTRLRLIEEAFAQFMAFIPEEAAIGIAAEYNKRLEHVEKMFPEDPPPLIITRAN
jgi:hypothetical protein